MSLAFSEPSPGSHAVDRAQRTSSLLLQAAAVAEERERRRLLDEVVLLNRGVAEALARQFRGRGIDEDDLRQVACLGLLKAVQRFDPTRDENLLAFAVPTIRGELRRYFRDHGWMVRPTRAVQEAQWRISKAHDRLSQELGRPPTPAEVRADLGLTAKEYDEAHIASGCFQPSSLDQPVTGDETVRLADLLANPTDHHDICLARVTLAPLLRRLTDRDREILRQRFYEDRTQTEIGHDIGITQTQVSRLLKSVLHQLRRQLDDSGDVAGDRPRESDSG